MWGFPAGSNSKESACNVGDPGSIPRLGRSPGEGNGYSLQYSFFFNLKFIYLFNWRIIALQNCVGEGRMYGKSNMETYIQSVQFSSVAQLCPTLCDPMFRSMPGLPVH